MKCLVFIGYFRFIVNSFKWFMELNFWLKILKELLLKLVEPLKIKSILNK